MARDGALVLDQDQPWEPIRIRLAERGSSEKVAG
jgi:hypothetical protein